MANIGLELRASLPFPIIRERDEAAPEWIRKNSDAGQENEILPAATTEIALRDSTDLRVHSGDYSTECNQLHPDRTLGEQIDEFAVCGEKIHGGQVARLAPGNLFEGKVLRSAGRVGRPWRAAGARNGYDGAAKEDQFHGARHFGVLVRGAIDLWADRRGDAEFFAKFASERRFETFSLLDLAAGKFPHEGECGVASALTDEQLAAGFDERCDHGKFGMVGHR